MTAEQEINRRRLLELQARPGNGNCADCGASDPTWASFILGVFVCQNCSGIHRSIPHVSKIKSVVMDPWHASEVKLMSALGNNAAKVKYEQRVPPFYYKPTFLDCHVLLEQWVRARYERNEFVCVDKQEPYSTGYREGFLWKRGRDNGQFLNRKFILSEREGVLKYFNKHDAREPKAIMKIQTLNATFQPSKIGNPHGLQITYLKDNSTRNIFVYHEDGKEIVDWFNAIRAARFHYLQVAFPGASESDLVPKLTRNYVKEGYMEKTGPKHTEGFKKRWFTMDDRRLMYFKDPLDAYARGEVFIGSKENSYSLLPSLPPSTQGNRWPYGITIVTPERNFLFTCETEAEQSDWIGAFQVVINRPMLPQEFAGRHRPVLSQEFAGRHRPVLSQEFAGRHRPVLSQEFAGRHRPVHTQASEMKQHYTLYTDLSPGVGSFIQLGPLCMRVFAATPYLDYSF
ncbi:arf-GAP with dual PH domain-containing protein 1-like isoform X5 [Brienomyrus brachyistius]|uniref:arf-GAP with dual PH domain-containing protein 1-like isoform X5 n=1 Tax=Brienomyrus brachyistius TaxID=42636 RepID=UPI0020B39B33|nr:arf-GAP with dual PH domain-containing protein 1-like isoform X5 [Brienomyrus brachyistius]